MRVAVISDIHADLPAVERVLSAIDTTKPDEVWCLGDVVGLGGGEPAEVVDLVREKCVLVLAGNHDAWVTGALTLDLLPLPRQRTELTWQRSELSDEHLAWLAAIPSYARRAGVELWHGSADDPLTGWVHTREDAIAHLNRQRAAIGLVGHTHRAALAHRRRGVVRRSEPPPECLDLKPGGQCLLNPGAVTGPVVGWNSILPPRWLPGIAADPSSRSAPVSHAAATTHRHSYDSPRTRQCCRLGSYPAKACLTSGLEETASEPRAT